MKKRIKHYFGANVNKDKFYKNWQMFRVECGITIQGRDTITYDKRRVSCNNCRKRLGMATADNSQKNQSVYRFDCPKCDAYLKLIINKRDGSLIEVKKVD